MLVSCGKVHFATLMDICHLKKSVVRTNNTRSIKGESCSEVAKDDSGSNAVNTEQGTFASRMTAAKVMDVIARRRDSAEQAADAVSAHTQVKMEDGRKLLRIPKS